MELKIYTIPKDVSNTQYFECNDNVLEILRENYTDDIINKMNCNEIFNALLEYEGIINYTEKIKQMIYNVYEVDLDEVNYIRKA